MSVTPVFEPTTYRWSSRDEGDRFTVENPANGEVIAVVQGGGAAEVDGAVRAAHQAFQTWRWLTPEERAPIIMRC